MYVLIYDVTKLRETTVLFRFSKLRHKYSSNNIVFCSQDLKHSYCIYSYHLKSSRLSLGDTLKEINDSPTLGYFMFLSCRFCVYH